MIDVIEGQKLCVAKPSSGPLRGAVQPVRLAPVLAGVQKSKWKGKRLMRVRPELDPDVDDEAPDGPDITVSVKHQEAISRFAPLLAGGCFDIIVTIRRSCCAVICDARG